MGKKMYTEGDYFEKNPTWHTQDSEFKAEQVLQIINKNSISPDSICEVGCGAGEILNCLYAKMSSDIVFTGYEISPQAFKICEPKEKERLQFHLKDILQDDLAFYDLVLVMDVIEHVEDYYSFLRQLNTKGQYKVFRIPLDISVKTIFQRCTHILKERETVGHIHYFTKEIVLAALEDTGYEVLDCFFTPCITYLRNKSFKTMLERLPINLLFKFNQDATVRFFGGYSLVVLAK